MDKGRRTDNVMDKGKRTKDKQWSIDHYTYNKRLNNTNLIKTLTDHSSWNKYKTDIWMTLLLHIWRSVHSI